MTRRRPSVRARLTLLVVLVTGAALAVFSSWGSRRVEDAMIDRALDALDAPVLLAPVPSSGDATVLVRADPGTEHSAFLIETARVLTAEAAEPGAASDLFDVLDLDAGAPLPVEIAPSAVALVGSDAIRIVPLDDVHRAVSLFLAQELAFALGDPALGFAPANDARRDTDFAFRVIERPGTADVVVGQSVGDIRETVRRIRHALLLVSPLLVVLAGGAAWLLAGRALRPVRLMTTQVDEITSAGQGAHVPEPATRDEIGHLARTMNAMLDRIASADAARRRFVSDASHELRSPLTVIRSEAELAAADPASTDTATLAEGVLAEARRLERVVDDLLALARLDEDRPARDVAVIDLDDVVLEEAARRRRVPVDVAAVSAGRVRASAAGMRRVVQHLLDNAATHASTRAAVALRCDGHAVVLEVADDGPGIDPIDHERVFERFTRLDEARARDTGGAGLGLSVVAALVEEAGGTVAVAAGGAADDVARAGSGAVFRVRLPAVD